jgi:[ribosomal protein S18]-alanine N-acetyltransferase
LSLSDISQEQYSAVFRSYLVETMREQDLIEVVEIEEMSGLNRWGYDAYRRELFTNPNSVMMVARNLHPGPMIAGFFAGWIVEDEMHINNVAARPAFRRIGVARSLLEAAMDESRYRGVRFVLLEVRASNEAAQTLYKKLGFKLIGRRRDYYRAPAEDALVMRRELD